MGIIDQNGNNEGSYKRKSKSFNKKSHEDNGTGGWTFIHLSIL